MRVGGRSGWCERCAAVGVAAGQGGRGTRADEGERASGRGGSCTDRVRCQLMVLLAWSGPSWRPGERRAGIPSGWRRGRRGRMNRTRTHGVAGRAWRCLTRLERVCASGAAVHSRRRWAVGGARSSSPGNAGRGPSVGRGPGLPSLTVRFLELFKCRRLTHTTRCGHRQGAPRAESTLRPRRRSSLSLAPVSLSADAQLETRSPPSATRSTLFHQRHAPSSLQHRLTGRAAAPRASPRRRDTGCAS